MRLTLISWVGWVFLLGNVTGFLLQNSPVHLPGMRASKEAVFADWITSDVWEEVDRRTLSIEGTIPDYVDGFYIKNGPGAFGTVDQSQRYEHAFDGLAKLQSYLISKQRVEFSTRFINSRIFRSAQRNKLLPHIAVGPVNPPFSKFNMIWGSALFDNACVNIERFGKDIFCAITDNTAKQQFDIRDLSTVGSFQESNIDGANGIFQFSSAHSKSKDGCVFNYYLENGLTNTLHIIRTNPDLSRTSIGKLPVGASFSYVHEMSLTDNYAVVALCPLRFDFLRALKTGTLLPELMYNDQDTAQIVLFDLRQERPPKIFETVPFWAYHHVNAYETDEQKLVLDVIGYDQPGIINGPHGYLYLENMRQESTRLLQEREGPVWRFTMNLKDPSSKPWVQPTRKIMRDPDSGEDLTFELPTVSPAKLGRPYRFVYGFTGFYQGKLGYMEWSIVKQDVESNTFEGAWYEENMYPGEASFIPNPKGTDEDDGVLLSTVYDAVRKENFLLVLDAQTMKEVARAYTGIAWYVVRLVFLLVSLLTIGQPPKLSRKVLHWVVNARLLAYQIS